MVTLIRLKRPHNRRMLSRTILISKPRSLLTRGSGSSTLGMRMPKVSMSGLLLS